MCTLTIRVTFCNHVLLRRYTEPCLRVSNGQACKEGLRTEQVLDRCLCIVCGHEKRRELEDVKRMLLEGDVEDLSEDMKALSIKVRQKK